MRHAGSQVSRVACRLFLTNREFRKQLGNVEPVVLWVNMESEAEVDAVFAEWKAAGPKVVAAPEDKAWKLREFLVADVDGNLIRVFYDFHADV
jgi:uncharacterized glyoxalase superfamily protein PhnB